jgi:hypothetical protein
MKKLIIALLVLGLFLAACEDRGGQAEGEKELPFIGGTTGLLVSFAQDAPPAEVYDGGDFPFDIEIKLQNDGERNIARDDITVEITGIDPAEFDKKPADFILTPADDLEAKLKDTQGNIIESNPEYVNVSDLNHKQYVTGTLRYPVFASICYRYGTDAVGTICIKENLYETGGACEVVGEKTILSSGAPLQITGLQESIAGANKINFWFAIEHKGNGKILKQDTQCNKDNLRGIDNKVFVSVSTGMAGLECRTLRDGTQTSGFVTLVDGSATVSCTQTLTTPGTYIKTVDIKAEYDYQEDIATSILLIHSE